MGGTARGLAPFPRTHEHLSPGRVSGWHRWCPTKLLLAGLLALLACAPGLATTPAGTVISNVATLACDFGSVASDSADVAVPQIGGCQVTPESGVQQGVAGGLVFPPVVVTNAGNGSDTFALGAASVAGWQVVIYRDDDGDAQHQSGETTVLTSTGPLAMGAQAACVLAVSLPIGVTGADTVALTARSGYDTACYATATFLVESVASMAADFSASPATGQAPLAVQFTDLSSGSPASWLWDFGDGAASGERNPNHVYGRSGSYTVSLTVSNSTDQSTVTRNGCISVSAGDLSASFDASPRKGRAPHSVAFTDLTSGEPIGWTWEFGDGVGSTEQDPTHQYASPGIYGVALQVTDGMTTSTTRWSRCIIALKQRSTSVVFSDVPLDYWAYGGVMGCYDVDLVAGYPDGTYRPGLSVSRDQMAVYISRALAGNDQNVPSGPSAASFADVPVGNWAHKYVEYARSQGIALGYPDGLFRPQDAINRAQMAVFLARLLAEPAGEGGLATYTPPQTPRFADVGQTGPWSWSYKYVEYIASKGITSGYPDGGYHPEVTCTRDQMAEFLARGLWLE